jgi:hypothetical protein
MEVAMEVANLVPLRRQAFEYWKRSKPSTHHPRDTSGELNVHVVPCRTSHKTIVDSSYHIAHEHYSQLPLNQDFMKLHN